MKSHFAAFLPMLMIVSGRLAALPNPVTQVPVADRATPHTQNGLTLLAIVRGNAQGQYRFPIPARLDFLSGPVGNGPPGGFGLWVRGINPPPSHIVNGRLVAPMNIGMPTSYGQAANGGSIPVQCQPQYSGQNPDNGQASAPLYLLTFPGGYPPHMGPITVSINTPEGHHAQWRLDDLPPSYHAISGTVSLQSAFAQAGVRLNVRAWRESGPPFMPPGQGGDIRYQINAAVPAHSHWLVRITEAQLEWEALTPAQKQAGVRSEFAYGRVPSALSTMTFGGPLPVGYSPYAMSQNEGTVQTPYGGANRYLRLTGQLIKLATAQESVTFHHLNVRQQTNPYAPRGMEPGHEISARPQTAVTPSGISMTLLPFSALPQGGGYFGNMGGVQMLLRFNSAAPALYPGSPPFSLPKSPIARRYHKPVTFTVSATHTFMLQQMFPVGSAGFPGAHPVPMEYIVTLMPTGRPTPIVKLVGGRRSTVFAMPKLPRYLDSLTLTITQQAQLHTLPVGFLVPIQSKGPR